MDFTSHLTWIRIGIGSVWLVFALAFKALNLVPRHRQMIARIVGKPRTRAATTFIVLGECVIGIWMIYGRHLVPCVVLQTLAIVTMNTLELQRARDLLWSPTFMVFANVLLLGLGWYVALAS